MIINSYRFGTPPVLNPPVWIGTPAPPDGVDGDPYSYDVSALVINSPTSYVLNGTWPG